MAEWEGRSGEDEAEETYGYDPADLEPQPFPRPGRKRVMWGAAVVGALVLMAVLPPLVNVSRFRRQVSTSIGASLGRPVHMDNVTLNMLPMPGLTLENFTVMEDPAFGAEPVIHAGSVKARLRWRSLWRGRVEFSRITLTEPSVNLVHRADGQWNVESILMQASRMPAAPTGQKTVGDAPRFPYIEATGARVNVKMGAEKMAISLTEADFALWLASPEQWRVRLEGKPNRTDGPAMDSGLVRVLGTLGRAGRLEDVPVDLEGTWSAAPLGAVSRVLTGRDEGFRGDMTLRVTVQGKAGDNVLGGKLQVTGLRRADFVPARNSDVDMACKAQVLGVFHRLSGVKCEWPSGAVDMGLLIVGEVPDTLRPRTMDGMATVKGVAAEALLDGARMLSPRLRPELTLAGTLEAQARCCSAGDPPEVGAEPTVWDAGFTVKKARLTLGAGEPFVDSELDGEWRGGELILHPVELLVGGTGAAMFEGFATVEGLYFTLSGYVDRSRLLELAGAVPPIGDGLAEAVATGATIVDLEGRRTWAGGMKWQSKIVAKVPKPRRGRRRR